ncbi:MAG TPA: LysR family transcriptional regulator, partial [Microbacterium sp.]|uniref:LysR family transcriptional regulator n=1 Tax=Microbacterium sp. TaxID=51671 RepID=UPI002B88E38C
MDDLSRLDLNLLATLDAILTEASVSRAAERLRLSAPTVSGNLSRLRAHFGDALLARSGNSYHLTPLARRLATVVPAVVDATLRVFAAEPAFDPASSTRSFVLAGTDYSYAVIGAGVERRARREAPRVQFAFVQHLVGNDDFLGLRSIDGMILPHGLTTENIPHLDIYEDRWVALVSADSDAARDGLGLDDLRTLPWVATYRSRDAQTPIGRQLQTMGIVPSIECVVESFLAVPYFIAGTDRVAIVQQQLANRLTVAGDVAVLPLPFEALPIVGALWWHPMHTEDPGHEWMRSHFAQQSHL